MATATLSPFVAWLGENFWSKLDDADLQSIQEAYMRGHGVDALTAKVEAGLRVLGRYVGPQVADQISEAMAAAEVRRARHIVNELATVRQDTTESLRAALRSFAEAYPRMGLDTKPGALVMFDGCGGSEHEKKFALQVLRMRELYEVERVNVGDCSSTVKLKGIVHEWNTVMFAAAPSNALEETGSEMPNTPVADGVVHADGYWTRNQGDRREARFGSFLLLSTANEFATQAYKAGLVAGMKRCDAPPAVKEWATIWAVLAEVNLSPAHLLQEPSLEVAVSTIREMARRGEMWSRIYSFVARLTGEYEKIGDGTGPGMVEQRITALHNDALEFKNFHRLLCERFGLTHDEKDWRRDQLSLIDAIAQQLPPRGTKTVRYDLSEAETEGELRAKLIEMGWSPPGDKTPTPDQVRRMVNRFLGWRLPETFAPDGYIKFDRELMALQKYPSWPIGTNLLTADQARDMFEYVLGDGPQVDVSDGWTRFDGSYRDDLAINPDRRWPSCPVTALTKVRVKLRDGTQSDADNPELLRWAWNLRPDAASDIVAYKIVSGGAS